MRRTLKNICKKVNLGVEDVEDTARKICFLLSSINGSGGTARAVSLLLNELRKDSRYQLSVICYTKDNTGNGYYLDERIPVKFILDQRMNMRKAFLRVLLFLLAYLKKNKIDTIVACGVLYFPAAIIAAKMVGCRVICWDHSNYTCIYDAKFERQARDFAAYFSDVLITLTRKDIENYKRHTKVRATIDYIHNVLDPFLLNRNTKYQANAKKIISVGRMTYAKNLELMVEIAAKVLPKHPDWVWDIYGNGELFESIQQKINTLNVKGLTLQGVCYDIYDRYPEYAFLVMTSRYEGFPMVLLEAIASSVPVIAFDCQTGPSDIITTNHNGILVKENDIDTMIREIENLIDDSDRRQHLAQNCLSSLEKFSTNEILDKWQLYLWKEGKSK